MIDGYNGRKRRRRRKNEHSEPDPEEGLKCEALQLEIRKRQEAA